MHFTNTPRNFKLTKDCSLDEFTELVQQTLMLAPYSRQLRELKRFAEKNAAPQFLSTYLAKWELFEKQQQQFRPNCGLSFMMYWIEKSLGRIFSSRAFMPALLAMVIAGTYVYNHLPDWRYPNHVRSEDLNELLEAYGMRVEKPASAANENSSNANKAMTNQSKEVQFTEQLLRSLRNPLVQKELRDQLDAQSTIGTQSLEPRLSDKGQELPPAQPPFANTPSSVFTTSDATMPVEASGQ